MPSYIKQNEEYLQASDVIVIYQPTQISKLTQIEKEIIVSDWFLCKLTFCVLHHNVTQYDLDGNIALKLTSPCKVDRIY